MSVDVQAAIAADYVYVDATETVTLLQPGSTTGITVTNARRTNRPTNFESVGQGMLPGTLVTFYLWVNVCSEKPKLTAKITDAGGVVYRVAGSELTTMRTRYDVECVRET